jgi:hypothetical protein
MKTHTSFKKGKFRDKTRSRVKRGLARPKTLSQNVPIGNALSALPKSEVIMSDAFSQWFPLRDLALVQMPQHGQLPAVYALRDGRTGDILKFGCTNDLRRRIFGTYIGGVGGKTTQRIHDELFQNNMIDRVELAWIEARDAQEAKDKETEFRLAYKEVNKGKRPSWDLIG